MCAFVSSFVRKISTSSLPTRSTPSLPSFKMGTGEAKAGTSTTAASSSITLYGAPVSNYTARCRYIVYRKQLTDQISLRSPLELGGIKSEEYLKLNPFGKIPVAIVHGEQADTTIFESSVICEYIAEKFDNVAPSFIPDTVEGRACARTIASILDVYIGQLHPYMYKKDVIGDRAEGAAKMKAGFDALEHVLDPKGPYATGSTLSIADCCLWGNFAFYDYMLPTFFGWSATDGRPKLTAWRNAMATESQAARNVYNEVFGALSKWWDDGRWTKLDMTPMTGRPSSTV